MRNRTEIFFWRGKGKPKGGVFYFLEFKSHLIPVLGKRVVKKKMYIDYCMMYAGWGVLCFFFFPFLPGEFELYKSFVTNISSPLFCIFFFEYIAPYWSIRFTSG